MRVRSLAWGAVVILAAVSAATAQPSRTSVSTGTGFLVSSDGYILTNEHVVAGSTDVTVVLDRSEYVATVVAAEPQLDLALLKISGTDHPHLRIGDSDDVRIGDLVFTIGCPLGICGTLSQGAVANVDPTGILADLTLASGSSGGPLLDARGNAVGVTTSVLMFGSSPERSKMPSGFSFAVPMNLATPLLQCASGIEGVDSGSSEIPHSADSILSLASPSIVEIHATVLRLLSTFLPQVALGTALEVTEAGPFHFTRSVLEREGFGIDSATEARASVSLPSVRRAINILLVDLDSTENAGRAKDFLLSTPPDERIGTTTSFDPYGGKWGFGAAREVPISSGIDEATTILKDSKAAGAVVASLYVAWYHSTYWGETVTSCLGFIGEATFRIEDLLFVIQLREYDYGSDVPPESGWAFSKGFSCELTEGGILCTWENALLGGSRSYVASVDLSAFMESFESLLNATLVAVSD